MAAVLVRTDYFFYLVPTLGLMALGPIVFVVRWMNGRVYRTTEARRMEPDPVVARFCIDAAILLVVSYLIWVATLFGPKSTLLHQGSYLVPILAFVLGLVLLWLASPRLALAAVSASVAYQVYLYTFATPPNLTGGMIAHPTKSGMAALIVSFVVSVAVYLWIGRPGSAAPVRGPSPSTIQQTHGSERDRPPRLKVELSQYPAGLRYRSSARLARRTARRAVVSDFVRVHFNAAVAIRRASARASAPP